MKWTTLNSPSIAICGLLLIQHVPTAQAAGIDCRDTATALEYWRPIKLNKESPSPAADSLALELIDCLGSRNAELRDQIGYELFAHWLRNEWLSNTTRSQLLEKLSLSLLNRDDREVLRRSFSALILAELMRSDALNPFMSSQQREELLQNTITALAQENEFRGLDEDIGWVHPVAHMSDLLWRFALHPETSQDQAASILSAVKNKVSPEDVAYQFNESDRLARAVTTLIQKQLVSTEVVAEWLSSFSRPVSMESWRDAFQSPTGMTELHNTKQFMRALSDQLEGEVIDPAIENVLDRLVQGFTQLI